MILDMCVEWEPYYPRDRCAHTMILEFIYLLTDLNELKQITDTAFCAI